MKDKIIMELIKAAVLKDIIKTKEEVREMLYFNEDFCDFCGEEYVIMSGSRMTKMLYIKVVLLTFVLNAGGS